MTQRLFGSKWLLPSKPPRSDKGHLEVLSHPLCLEVERGGLGPGREEDTLAAPQPRADPYPSNTCSSFLTAWASSKATRRERREGGKAGDCGRGIRAALTAPPPGHLVARPLLPLPERVGCRQERKRLVATASLPPFSTPPTLRTCLSPRFARGWGWGDGTVAWS